MRTVLVGVCVLVCLATAAQAERRMFIIANDADGYGVDRCLASGEKCGHAAATAYCKTQDFAQAANYHKVDRDDVTGAIPVGPSANAKTGDNLVAIVCTR